MTVEKTSIWLSYIVFAAYFVFSIAASTPFNDRNWGLYMLAFAAFTRLYLFCRQSLPAWPAPLPGLAGVLIIRQFYLSVLPERHTWLLLIFLLVIVCLRLPLDRVLLTWCLAVLCIHLTQITAALGGSFLNVVYTERNLIRSSMGSAHTNTLACYLFLLLLMVYSVPSAFPDGMHLLFTLLVMGFISYVTRTRTVVLCCIPVLLHIIWRFCKKRFPACEPIAATCKKPLDFLALFSFPLNALLWFFFVFLYDRGHPLAQLLNNSIAGRVLHAHNTIRLFGIAPFGTPSAPINYPLDNAYSNLMFYYGWAGLVIWCIVYILISYRFLRAGHRRLLYAMALIAVYANTEIIVISFSRYLLVPLVFTDFSRAPDKNRPLHRPFLLPLALSLAVFALFPVLMSRMRTISQLKGLTDFRTHMTVYLPLFFAWLLFFGVLYSLYLLSSEYLRVKSFIKTRLLVPAVWLIACTAAFFYGTRALSGVPAEAAQCMEEDAHAVETILASKTGTLYSDIWPEYYVRQFPGVSRTLWTGNDLARKKNATVIMDADIDCSNTFMTQGFSFTEISDRHVVYTNDAAVREALAAQGYPLSDYYSRTRSLNLSDYAQYNGYEYDESEGIIIDRPPAPFPPSWWADSMTLRNTGAPNAYSGRYRTDIIMTVHEAADHPSGTDMLCEISITDGATDFRTHAVLAKELPPDGTILLSLTFDYPADIFSDPVTVLFAPAEGIRISVQHITMTRLP